MGEGKEIEVDELTFVLDIICFGHLVFFMTSLDNLILMTFFDAFLGALNSLTTVWGLQQLVPVFCLFCLCLPSCLHLDCVVFWSCFGRLACLGLVVVVAFLSCPMLCCLILRSFSSP